MKKWAKKTDQLKELDNIKKSNLKNLAFILQMQKNKQLLQKVIRPFEQNRRNEQLAKKMIKSQHILRILEIRENSQRALLNQCH